MPLVGVLRLPSGAELIVRGGALLHAFELVRDLDRSGGVCILRLRLPDNLHDCRDLHYKESCET